MNKYYSKEEITKAKEVEIIDVIKELNMSYKSANRIHGEPAYRLEEHDSFVFHGTYWAWNSKDERGKHAIDFLTKCMNFKFTEAIGFALQAGGYSQSNTYAASNVLAPRSKNQIEKPKEETHLQPKEFALPKAYGNCNRVIAYLSQTRGIDYNIIKKLIKEKKIYEAIEVSKNNTTGIEKKYHNAVFVGHDNNNVALYAFKRGTLSNTSTKFAGEVDGSKKAYAFGMDGTTDQVRVFESAIDALSYLTINKDCKDTLQSLGGGSLEALERVLKEYPDLKKIKVCTDNDKAGLTFLKKIQETYEKKYEISADLPKRKDWNEDLLFLLQSKKMEMTL